MAIASTTGRATGSKATMVHQQRHLQAVAGRGRARRHERVRQVWAALLCGVIMTGCAMAPPRQTPLAPPPVPIPAASAPEALAAGARLYQQHCAPCHGDEGRSGLAAPLNQYGHAWHHPDSVLTQTIREGTSRSQADLALPDLVMPPFGPILTPEEIRTLIAFCKAAWTPDQQHHQWERTERADLQLY
jgi:mono/diheme cytochrome c family protein